MEIASHLAIPYFKRLKKVFFCSQQYSQGNTGVSLNSIGEWLVGSF